MNSRWKLTSDAIVHSDPDYRIAFDRLLETRSHSGLQIAMWPLQIAEKSWADLEEFLTVFRAALTQFDEAEIAGLNLPTSLAAAREIVSRRPLR